MSANFVPFGSFPGGIMVGLLALLVAGALITFDWSGSDDHSSNNHDDVS